MGETVIDVPVAPNPPIFELDLGANGGLLWPTSGQECLDWIETERQSWVWLTSASSGNHRNAIDQAINPLHQAFNEVQQALGYERSNTGAFRERMINAGNLLNDCYNVRKFPHSSSTLAKRVQEIAKRDVLEAHAYLFVFLPQTSGYQFDARDNSSWRGFIEGLVERYGISTVPHEGYQAALSSLDDLRTKMGTALDDRAKDLAGLHRDYTQLREAIKTNFSQHEEDMATFFKQNQDRHDKAFEEHAKNLEAMQNAFREGMTLRAPVEYWENRQTHHDNRAQEVGRWAFGSMLSLSVGIGGLAYWVLNNLTVDGKPDAWRVAVLGLIGALGVWAIRLIVRIFLSHSHLATDAAERVTMVKTYLSLLESDKMPSDDDRKLILQSLFRSAADGLVKDEGLPNPVLDALTRIGSK